MLGDLNMLCSEDRKAVSLWEHSQGHQFRHPYEALSLRQRGEEQEGFGVPRSHPCWLDTLQGRWAGVLKEVASS